MKKRKNRFSYSEEGCSSLVSVRRNPAIAIVLALIVCAIVTTITTGINPIQVYESMIIGAFWLCQKDLVTFPEYIHSVTDRFGADTCFQDEVLEYWW